MDLETDCGTHHPHSRGFGRNMCPALVSEDGSGSITWKKGAQFEEVSGDTFDLGNATEEEWQDLLHEIFAAMLGGF